MSNKTKANILGVWRVVWAARWFLAMFTYLCVASLEGAYDWDWFVVTTK